MRKSSKRTAKPASVNPYNPGIAPSEPATVVVVPVPVFSAGNIARTASTVAAERTHYGVTSSRDDAYCAFYTREADASNSVTLAMLATFKRNPLYAGSAKPHDAGAIVRAIKAGTITRSDDGRTLMLTEAGATRGRLILSKLAKQA